MFSRPILPGVVPVSLLIQMSQSDPIRKRIGTMFCGKHRSYGTSDKIRTRNVRWTQIYRYSVHVVLIEIDEVLPEVLQMWLYVWKTKGVAFHHGEGKSCFNHEQIYRHSSEYGLTVNRETAFQ